MRSSFYYEGHHHEVGSRIKEYINSAPEFLTTQTAHSPRAVGDALESIVADRFDSFVGDWCSEYSSDVARRAMADLAFIDKEDIYSRIDVKTHREDTRFNMLNLTSVERLARFYESDTNVFSLILIRYSIHGVTSPCPRSCSSQLSFWTGDVSPSERWDGVRSRSRTPMRFVSCISTQRVLT